MTPYFGTAVDTVDRLDVVETESSDALLITRLRGFRMGGVGMSWLGRRTRKFPLSSMKNSCWKIGFVYYRASIGWRQVG